MVAEFVEPIGVDEARRRLPALLRRFRRDKHAEPVAVGAYRHADAVLVPAERYRWMTAVIERLRASEDALGSIRAEGLEPSAEAQADMQRIVVGDIMAEEAIARAVSRHRGE